jgi:hypothetical protein
MGLQVLTYYEKKWWENWEEKLGFFVGNEAQEGHDGNDVNGEVRDSPGAPVCGYVVVETQHYTREEDVKAHRQLLVNILKQRV